MMAESALRHFEKHFGVTEADIRHYLSAALERGGDFADLYFEHQTSSALLLDESLVKSASQGISAGMGVRVLAGERTGYAYSDDLSPEKLLRAARTAAHIASGPARTHIIGLRTLEPLRPNLYPVTAPQAPDLQLRLSLVQRADVAARASDSRIRQVRVSFADELKQILIASSDGTLAADTQPLSRLHVFCLASAEGRSERGSAGGGGRSGLEQFQGELAPEALACHAAQEAVRQLSAHPCPAGEMEVVLGPGWPGILLHEAVGHGLEADFIRKRTSAFAGRLGQRIASEHCTVVDDGTLRGRRGSINLDDEGAPSEQTVLIEKGILRAYLQDRLNSSLLGSPRTGNGRRESYAHMPMPRMTNTYMLAGEDDPEEIVRSVRRGIYAANFGGGQVDITSGKFVFSASESYLIEDGRLTAPLRGATLIGSGPDVLTHVSRVGHDLKLDLGIGTCGKDGQSVPVGVGLPTIKIDRLTVGGTQT